MGYAEPTESPNARARQALKMLSEVCAPEEVDDLLEKVFTLPAPDLLKLARDAGPWARMYLAHGLAALGHRDANLRESIRKQLEADVTADNSSLAAAAQDALRSL